MLAGLVRRLNRTFSMNRLVPLRPAGTIAARRRFLMALPAFFPSVFNSRCLLVRNYPLSFLVMEVLAMLCFIPAIASLAGVGARLHPLLADTGAGIAMLVTAISLLISGFFPLVLRRLMNREAATEQTADQ